MEKKKQKRLEKAGWKVGTAAEFLGMSPAEAQLAHGVKPIPSGQDGGW